MKQEVIKIQVFEYHSDKAAQPALYLGFILKGQYWAFAPESSEHEYFANQQLKTWGLRSCMQDGPLTLSFSVNGSDEIRRAFLIPPTEVPKVKIIER